MLSYFQFLRVSHFLTQTLLLMQNLFLFRDLYIMRRFAQVMEKFRTTFTYNRPYDVQLLDTFAGASLKELDYINEASNQEEFRKEFLHRLVINFLNKNSNLGHKIFKTMTKKIFISKGSFTFYVYKI